MLNYYIHPSKLSGCATLPSSKSHTLRAILFGTLAHGTTEIHNYLPSPDTDAMIQACQLFGANIEKCPKTITIKGLNGNIQHAEDVINAGNSGLVLRFCAAIGALASNPVVVTGDHSIKYNRPIKPLINGLIQAQVFAKSMRHDDHAPIIVQGPFIPSKIEISGEDSQPVSALLITAAFAKGPTELYVTQPGEKPWISLTLNWFDKLGIAYQNNDYCHYTILGNSKIQGFNYLVPGDHSSAAFLIAAALITKSELTIQNFDLSDCQGDKEILNILKEMGAKFVINHFQHTLTVKKNEKLNGVTIDINNLIDAITILAVIGCFAEGETHIHNGSIARKKECDRIKCISKELKKMGADITETEDGLKIKKSTLHGATVESHNDHRMAMSLSIAAMGASGETIICNTNCIAKTFPTFVEDFQLLGACVSVKPVE